MKILMLTTNGSLMDGINRHILAIAPEVNSRDGFEVAVCIVQPAGEFHQSLNRVGVKVWSLGCKNGHRPELYFRFKKVINEFSPDVIHVHVLSMVGRILLSRRFKHLKYVVTVHGISDVVLKNAQSNFSGLRKKQHLPLRVRLERWLDHHYQLKYDTTCFISKGVRSRLTNGAQESLKRPICYNPIDFSVKSPGRNDLRELLKLAQEVPIIGTSCRIAEVKNPIAFTETMCKVLIYRREAHAVVLGNGEGSLIGKCKEIISRYDVESRFHWLGYREDARILVSDFDCFVMTSISEGLPTSVLEAFVARTPVAMLHGEGGLKDLIEINEAEGPILLHAPKDDLDGLATQIVELLGNDTMANCMAERAYEVGKRHFDVKSVGNQLCEIYRNVIEQ